MAKGMNLQFTVGEVIDGLKKIEITLDIPCDPSSSTETKDEIIDVTIAKHEGSTVVLDPMVRTIYGDLKCNSSMAINVPDQEMLKVKLKVESDIINGTNPSSSTPGENNLYLKVQRDPVSLSPEDLKMKTTSVLEDYFRYGFLHVALRFVEELNSPSYHPEIVKSFILLGMKNPQKVAEPVFNLFQHLLKKKVLGSIDVIEGCLQYAATMLEDWESDTPVALRGFGCLVGKLVSVGVFDFRVVKWILVELDDEDNRRLVFDSVFDNFRWDDPVLKSQSRDVAACRNLCENGRLSAEELLHDY